LHSQADLENGGLILICAMKLLLEKKSGIERFLKQRGAQECLFAVVNPDKPPLMVDEAREFWRTHADCCLQAMIEALRTTGEDNKVDEAGRLLRMQRHGSAQAGEAAIVAVTMAVRDAKHPTDEQLQMIINTATWLRKLNEGGDARLEALLKTLIKTASARQARPRMLDAAE
jgi:hypothetical protein